MKTSLTFIPSLLSLPRLCGKREDSAGGEHGTLRVPVRSDQSYVGKRALLPQALREEDPERAADHVPV